jgi:hypothetical protein
VIDCKRILYLNKCNLTGIKFVSFHEYMAKMEKYRKDVDIPIIIPPVHLERDIDPNMNGGGNSRNTLIRESGYSGNATEFYNKTNLSYYKDYFKQLYLSTKTQEYKKYYKTLKNALLN